jgi:hypothetical protein
MYIYASGKQKMLADFLLQARKTTDFNKSIDLSSLIMNNLNPTSLFGQTNQKP